MRRYDVVCLGEALVDMLPSRAGPLRDVPSFERHAGGALANVAVGVTRLGGRSALIGMVGEDPFGEFLRAQLASEGVDVSGLRTAQGQKTGVAFVSLNDHGQPSFFAAGRGGEELYLAPDDVATFPIEDAWVFHLGTYALSSGSVRRAAFAALSRAAEANVLVALDPNLRLHLWPDRDSLRRLLPELLRQTHVVKLSSDECEFVAGTSDPESAAKQLLAAGPSLAVVTTGPNGCVYAREVNGAIETSSIPARRVDVVDSTGAGDGFMAALLTSLARHRAAGTHLDAISRAQLRAILAVAVEAGSRVCEHVGAMAGLPRKGELAGFPPH